MSAVMTLLKSEGGLEKLRQLPEDAFDIAEISQWPLRFVVEQNLMPELELLLKRGANPSSDQLVVLIRNGRGDEPARRFLAAGFDLLATEDLQRAVLSRCSLAVIELVLEGSELDAATLASHIEHVLVSADPEVLAWCLAHEPAFSQEPHQLLSKALVSDERSLDVLRQLLAAGVRPAKTGELLVKAASVNKRLAFERVKLLVEAGVALEREGWSVLAEAAYRNNEDLTLWLLERGANATEPVGYSPYDWKDFKHTMSVADYARTKKGREWLAERLGDAEEGEDATLLVRDTIGFSTTESLGSLLFGRRVVVDLMEREDVLRAARLADWIEGLEDSPLSVVAEGTVGSSSRALFVGVCLATASAERAALELDLSVDDAKKQLAPYEKTSWEDLEERFGFAFAKERNAMWLVASGPLTSAALVYGGYGPRGKVTKLGVDHFVAVDAAGRTHPYFAFGAVEGTDDHRKVSFTKAAMKKRETKAKAATNPKFYLTARYD